MKYLLALMALVLLSCTPEASQRFQQGFREAQIRQAMQPRPYMPPIPVRTFSPVQTQAYQPYEIPVNNQWQQEAIQQEEKIHQDWLQGERHNQSMQRCGIPPIPPVQCMGCQPSCNCTPSGSCYWTFSGG